MARHTGHQLAGEFEILSRHEKNADAQYFISPKIGCGHVGIERETSIPCTIIPMRVDEQITPVRSRGMRIVGGNFSFRSQGSTFESGAMIVECIEPDLIGPFWTLAAQILDEFTEPDWPSVRGEVARWQELLAALQPLNRERVIGLWGELDFIQRFPDPILAIKSWVGPSGAQEDFYCASIRVECKTSTRDRIHTFTWSQTQDVPAAAGSFVVSLWVKPDPLHGSTLPELVNSVRSLIKGTTEFESRLLEAGYLDSDADLYTTCYGHASSPLWFQYADIPTVRVVDQGVRDVKYSVDLSGVDAVENPQTIIRSMQGGI